MNEEIEAGDLVELTNRCSFKVWNLRESIVADKGTKGIVKISHNNTPWPGFDLEILDKDYPKEYKDYWFFVSYQHVRKIASPSDG